MTGIEFPESSQAVNEYPIAAITDTVITYLVDGYYNPTDELGVLWSDPTIDADWGLADPILSARDESNPARADLPPGRRPYFPMRG